MWRRSRGRTSAVKALVRPVRVAYVFRAVNLKATTSGQRRLSRGRRTRACGGEHQRTPDSDSEYCPRGPGAESEITDSELCPAAAAACQCPAAQAGRLRVCPFKFKSRMPLRRCVVTLCLAVADAAALPLTSAVQPEALRVTRPSRHPGSGRRPGRLPVPRLCRDYESVQLEVVSALDLVAPGPTRPIWT